MDEQPIRIGLAQQCRRSWAQLIDAHALDRGPCPTCDLQGNISIGTCGNWPGEFQEGRHWMCLGSMGVRKEDLVVRLHYLLASPYIKIDKVAGYCPGVRVGWRFALD